MSELDQTVVDRAHTLLGGVKQTVERSRVTRQSAAVARQHSQELLDSLSRLTRTSQDEVTRSLALRQVRAAGRTDRRQHDRLSRPGRRQTDRRPAVADQRRLLLVGPDEAWRLLTTYLFEEAGYSVFAAGDPCQALAFSTRLLPDVLLVQMEAAETLELLARLTEASSTCDIPVVVLTRSLQSPDARLARAAGGVTVFPRPDPRRCTGRRSRYADRCGAARAAHAQAPASRPPGDRAVLLTRCRGTGAAASPDRPSAGGDIRGRRTGHCVAASQGATRLTGYSRLQLLTTSVFQSGFAGGHLSDEGWRGFLTKRHMPERRRSPTAPVTT